jgi:aryl-phospho-beta-D-glucosidase BglC (GH1 family)
MMEGFLQVKKDNIVNEKGKRIILKGLNLGGWLMMEGYILGGRNIPEYKFKMDFTRFQNKGRLAQFTRLFRENFIRKLDFKVIQESGFNCVRIPFNFRLIQDGDFSYLKIAIEWCKKYGLYCILDLHAAPGSQNYEWHSDSPGEALLWKDKKYQKEFIRIWQMLVSEFKNEKAIAGFDILNEPVCKEEKILLNLYREAVKEIRKIDQKHIIFLEGNNWAQEVEFLGKPWDNNLVYSMHFYPPLEFTFGFVRNLRYPGRIYDKFYSKADLRRILLRYHKLKKKWQVPIYVGEFGQNSRCPYCHRELQWLKDTLSLFKGFNFHWTYWTYKAVASGIYPDGLYQYIKNPPWVCRHDTVFGWETYFHLWEKYKRDIVHSWHTESFKENKALSGLFSRP